MNNNTLYILKNNITFLNLQYVGNSRSSVNPINYVTPKKSKTSRQQLIPIDDLKELEFVKDFKNLINIYMKGSKENKLDCTNILLSKEHFKMILPYNSNYTQQQDSTEIFYNMLVHINSFIEKKLNLQQVNISNNTDFNNNNNTLLYNKIKKYTKHENNNSINPLIYLFGMFEKNKINKTHIIYGTPKYENFKYVVSYINMHIKFDNKNLKQNYKNIQDIIGENPKNPERLNVSNNNKNTYSSLERTEYNNIYFGKYAIINLPILFLDNKNRNIKINLTITNLTNDLNKDYEFFGAIFHIGSGVGGHYTSLVKKERNIYYDYNDTLITKINGNDIKKINKKINKKYKLNNPTMLVYKRKTKSLLDNETNDDTINFFKNNKDKINKIKQQIDTQRRGNINPSNICYFNAFISILLNIPEFVHLILNHPIFEFD